MDVRTTHPHVEAEITPNGALYRPDPYLAGDQLLRIFTMPALRGCCCNMFLSLTWDGNWTFGNHLQLPKPQLSLGSGLKL